MMRRWEDQKMIEMEMTQSKFLLFRKPHSKPKNYFILFEKIFFNMEFIYRIMLKSILNYIFVINNLVVEEDEVE